MQPSNEVTVAKLNQLVDSLDLRYWQAGDIGASGRLSDGRLVWAFGDTVRRSGVSPPVVANSLLVTTGPCVAQLIGAGPRAGHPGRRRDHGALADVGRRRHGPVATTR